MNSAVLLVLHLLSALAKQIRPGGYRTVVAENLLLKQQLIIHSRTRQRSPNMRTQDRTILGFLSLFLSPTRRIVGFSVHEGAVDGPALCRMFSEATARQRPPDRISKDNDPLFQYRQWKANLSILEIEEIKSLPYIPMSHPFVERLIGSVRRELLDQTFFWTKADLENKMRAYQQYFNAYRCHSSRNGTTPVESSNRQSLNLNNFHWEEHCRGLFQLPIAA